MRFIQIIRRYLSLLLLLLLLAHGVPANGDDPRQSPDPDPAVLDIADRELLGEGLYGRLVLHQQTQFFYFVENMRHGHGQGERFTLWQRGIEESDWQARPLFRNHHPGMVSLLPLDDGSYLFLYVDRKDESDRSVHLVRVDEEPVTLFSFQDNRGVLNPAMDMLPCGALHVLIPDRTGRTVRRFLIDLARGDAERLPDIETPRGGARIYSRYLQGNRLIVPLAVTEQLHLLVIDVTDHRHELRQLESFPSHSGEPPRNMALSFSEELDQFLLVYLRPAEFSDRSGRQGPRTGLVGQIVLRTLTSDTLEPIATTVIGGFSAAEAATHNFTSQPLGSRDVVLATTTVDRIHVRHLTGRYENYTGAWLTRWRVNSDGRAERVAKREIEPFYSANMVAAGDGQLLFSYNLARPGAPRVIARVVGTTDHQPRE